MKIGSVTLATADVISMVATIIALLALSASIFTFCWTLLRPAHLKISLTMVGVTRHGGSHITIPLSISNDGAKATTVTGVKLLETSGDDRSLYVAGLTTTPEKALAPMFGPVGKDDAATFVPFSVAPNTEVQRVFIFAPLNGGSLKGDLLAQSGKSIKYTVVVRSTGGDVSETKTVVWPSETDKLLNSNSGVGQQAFDVGQWQETVPK